MSKKTILSAPSRPRRSAPADPDRSVAEILAYHRSSCLEPDRPGAMPERLDRRTQPIPFRRYSGAPRLLLPLASEAGETAAADAGPEASPRLASLGRLLGSSLALGGWKWAEPARFGLRRVPSAGNLHPTESYVLSDGIGAGAGGGDGAGDEADTDGPALFHYSPFDHALERRRTIPPEVWRSLRDACPEASAFLALSTIYWRCAWKYGERSFRLCHLDAGHGMAALDAAAAL
ncbi:MAG: hypothetical protein MI919_19535, partial [Holophagales bacterium]|nr:hypothetical protein [Holophagales bacterium]